MQHLLRDLSGVLQDVIGMEDAAGFISVVGQRMGDRLDEQFRAEAGVDTLELDHLARVLVELKQRIEGDFYVIEYDEDRIVLGNRRCPFGEFVKGRESLCMMTSNVFGTIASNNRGYARVDIEKAIARGDPGCRVVLYLRPDDERAGDAGREYFGV
jgi:predicted ArsR family transcriptional regulator